MNTKVAKVLENGITGAATLTLLRETLDKIDPKGPSGSLLSKNGILRQLRKSKDKKGMGAVKIYVKLAAEMLGLVGYMGLTAVGKKKNAIVRGGVLGGMAGIVSVLMNLKDINDDPTLASGDVWRKRAITVALYIAAGLAAGGAFDLLRKNKKKKNKGKK